MMAAETDMAQEILQITHLSKRFGEIQALRDVHLHVHSHKVLALVGENGAGKSTLINVISGVFGPDTGTMRLNGKPIVFHNPYHALTSGIAVVHQELSLFPKLTVWENIFVGRERMIRGSLLHSKAMQDEARHLLSQVNLSLNIHLPAEKLSLSDQQLVEIIKALAWRPHVLILDEATSALDDQRVATLFALIQQLKAEGVGIVFVSHRLREVLDIADEATVLKDGQLVGDLPSMQGITESHLVEKMTGRPIGAIFPPKPALSSAQTVLEVKGLSTTEVHKVSLQVRSGEIVGVGGLDGHGQAHFLRALFGAVPHNGEIFVEGKRVIVHQPADAINIGIAYVPPDRKTEGLMLIHAVEHNLTLPILQRISNVFGQLLFGRERDVVDDVSKQMHIVQRQWRQTAGSLSGGNQQKVVLGKWLAANSRVLLLDEPTRGIDVGTKAEIYRFLRHLANEGVAIVMASTDNLEMLGMADDSKPAVRKPKHRRR